MWQNWYLRCLDDEDLVDDLLNEVQLNMSKLLGGS